MGKPKAHKMSEAELLESVPAMGTQRVRRGGAVLGYSSKPEQPCAGAHFVRTPEYEALLADALYFDEGGGSES